jgi:hypothetical protein
MTLRLISLDCRSCGSALHGEGFDTIFFCDHCGDAAILGEDGLEMVESAGLVPTAGRPVRTWRPGWLVEATVAVSERLRYRGRRSRGWQGPRTFVVPAFELALADLTRIARALSEAAGEAGEVPREPIHGGKLALDEALVLIRHIVIGDEVRKSDMLSSLIVDIEVVSSRLVAIPFELTKTGLRCSITGVTVHTGDT